VRLSLTRRVEFRASHYLRLPRLSEAENRERFGWTADPHEHRYHCSVTVSGPPVAGEGSVIDLGLLDRLIDEAVLRPLQGTLLNQSLPPCANGEALPVCETIAAWCFAGLEVRLPAGVQLDGVRIAEDATLHADCTRTV
jgi:6-pyruvoyltetrahydropterin/6-carboxytetrahydropterin synthase